MFGRNSINESVEWLGVPDFLNNYGRPWTVNVLAPYASWGDIGSSTNQNWGSQYVGGSERVFVLYNFPVHVLPVHHWGIFENKLSAVRRVRDDLLQNNRT